MILTKYFYNQKGKGSKFPKETNKKKRMRESSLGSVGKMLGREKVKLKCKESAAAFVL